MPRTTFRYAVALVAALTAIAFFVPVVVGTGAPAAHAAQPGAITLHVQSARTVGAAPGQVRKGDAVPAYHWLIAGEDVGNPHDTTQHCLPARAGGSAGFATGCQWPSVRSTAGAVPIIAQGDETDLNDTKAVPDLPPGRYLISVTADGYKIDGAHFTLDGGTRRVTVEMQPYPLPLGTVRVRVFDDSVPVDGTYEVGAEHGLAGFTAHLSDVLGEVSTDYYGNPLCTRYVHSAPDATHPAGQIVFTGGKPQVDPSSTGKCLSDANGDVVIPNLGPDRYAAQIVPPTGTDWAQTTTLEGAHDWDIWTQEGDTGFDTEQTVGAEPVPAVDFGFVRPKALPAGPTGEIKGVAVQIDTYVGGTSGVTVPNAGVAGASVRGPVDKPFVALSALGAGDQMVYMARAGSNGAYDIKNVPNGDYQLTLWDYPQELILDSFTVTVNNGQTVDTGQKGLVGWHTGFTGTIFVDANANGRQDPGEAGVPQFPVALKERDNSVMDQGINTVTTDAQGHYSIPEAYPLSKFLVLEAFNTRYKTTGITYQADNQPTATTLLGAAVDVSVLPIIGLHGRVDWGVQPYTGADNGGIVGTVTYDTTRNELDPRYAVTETYQPGIPDVPVHLYAVQRDANGDPVKNADGSVARGPELADTYTSETWQQPAGCVPRKYDGSVLTDQQAVGLPDVDPASCVEAPLQGVQVQPSDTTPGNFGQTVNGNYGFTSSKLNLYPPGDPQNPAPAHDLPLYADLAAAGYDEQTLLPDDYLVSVDIPQNPVGGKPMYQVTREEDVNIFDGDGYLPQENFPPSPEQSADQPNPAQPQPDPGAPPSQGTGIVAPCAGANHTVHVTDQAYVDGGGSPFEGQQKPLCDQKLVTVRGGQSTAPNFTLFTTVPLPTHFWGLTINDLALSYDKRSVEFGEAAGLPNVPMGIYDFSGRLVDTVDTDFNGFYEALEPSTSTYNCPLPAGPCPNMYRFVGNDPGQPGHVNKSYNPRFRTIATNFQAWPGLYTVTDTAPTQVANVAVAPGSTQVNPVVCTPPDSAPQIFSVSRPFVRQNDANRALTLSGLGFGAAKGTGQVVLTRPNGTTVNLATTSWSDTAITATVPAAQAAGQVQVSVRKADGQTTVNGIGVHLLGTGYNPRVLQVNPPTAAPPGTGFSTVQAALEAASTGAGQQLVVVWPGPQSQDNPQGAYYENIVVHSSVKLQGTGPGGFRPDGTYVRGSVLNGLGFNPDLPAGAAWFALVGGLQYQGPAAVPDSAVVTVLSPVRGGNTGSAIDGFTITGGAQADFATNLNDVYGGTKTPAGAPGAAITQGGGVYVHAAVNNLQLTDNVIAGNGGSYGGGIRVGTPYTTAIHNSGLVVSHNQIRDNGGTNLAGGVGLFDGTDNYSVDHNDLCGNFSAEYGGGISHYGLGRGGDIGHNRLWFNQSYDEAGGIMLAGELPADPNRPSAGSGPVSVHENLVQDNLANDDGGGIRLLQAGTAAVSIVNNLITDNISTHEGGGIALDDATNVRIVNNTVMKNVTTATAITSTGQPAPAGLSTTLNSAPLQATLPANAPKFSNPLLYNNVFFDNRAGTWNGLYVAGIASPQAPAGDPVRHWDMGSADAAVALTPTNSLLQQYDPGVTPSATNKIGLDPQVRAPFDVSATILTSRTFPSFREAVIVAQNVAPQLQGDYHLAGAGSPANAAGTFGRTYNGGLVLAPTLDYDGDSRFFLAPDAGADEFPLLGTARRAQ
ncbi:SdrD B-like domain-containing protein [Amycolatopsis sp. NPDC004625]|uniref:SdrD B-like domain-containing protein n=1 Tax=Amycolatopsis sp. NPDC004625 TaxID=3154670 RepID=UPI0033A400ED